jgi:DNA-binding protein YbaB
MLMTRPVLMSACAAALVWAAPSAHAFEDQGGVRLSLSGLASPGSVRLAPELSQPSTDQAALQRLINAATPAAGAELDSDAFEALRASLATSDDGSEPESRGSDLTPATGLADTGSASALPWYQRFTLAPAETRSVWGNRSVQEFQIQAGARWGVTLGYADSDRRQQTFGLEDFSAGAFFSLSDRVRLGGQLRFTSPEDEIFGEEGEERRPEIRFESAFRF